MFICPFVSLIAYFFLAKQYKRSVQEKLKTESLKTVFPISEWTDDNEVQVWSDGNAFFDALYQAIEQAQTSILFQFYIINDDVSGRRFEQILSSKAKQGVQVKVLYDALGSSKLTKDYINRIQASGVEIYAFLPVMTSLFKRKINYRNHRKNVVIDGVVGFMGGFNIGDEYVGGDSKLGYWRDTHLQITGGAVSYLQQLFQLDWELTSGKQLSLTMPQADMDKSAGRERMTESQAKASIQLVTSTPSLFDDVIYETYFDVITSAQNKLYIETPYFIPDEGMKTALKIAVKKGVDVRIILPSISDHALVQWATMSFVEDLLLYGIRVYQYKAGFLHAKVMIIDDKVIVGTANFDVRSFYNNFETNATIIDEQVKNRLLDDFYQDMSGSLELSLAEYRQRPLMVKVRQSFVRMIAPLF